MCVVSMISDHYYDEWSRRLPGPRSIGDIYHEYLPMPAPPSQQEIDEFRRLLERAREYDKRNREPNCELDEKKKKLMDLAEQLGVKIDFL